MTKKCIFLFFCFVTLACPFVGAQTTNDKARIDSIKLDIVKFFKNTTKYFAKDEPPARCLKSINIQELTRRTEVGDSTFGVYYLQATFSHNPKFFILYVDKNGWRFEVSSVFLDQTTSLIEFCRRNRLSNQKSIQYLRGLQWFCERNDYR